MTGPCAKTTVTCVITAPDGRQFIGTNASCGNPQKVCPRSPGEGYEKCISICQQQGHAEIQAIRAAGDHAQGAVAELRGHTYACQACQEALFAAGIKWLGVRKS
jgi:deoxycytidylate deaminase